MTNVLETEPSEPSPVETPDEPTPPGRFTPDLNVACEEIRRGTLNDPTGRWGRYLQRGDGAVVFLEEPRPTE